MDTSGKPREGWMAVIPATVFLVFVVFALGGPRNFLNTLSIWAGDLVAGIQGWLKSL